MKRELYGLIAVAMFAIQMATNGSYAPGLIWLTLAVCADD